MDYEVKECGCVFNILGKQIRPSKVGKGYAKVSFQTGKTKKDWLVHRLVLIKFKGLEEGKQCSHLDGNKLNNHINNLKWVTQKENEAHKKMHGTYPIGDKNPNSKLKKEDVLEIRKLYLDGFKQRQLSNMFNICKSQVSHIVSKKAWRSL